MFSVHSTPEKIKNATIRGSFWISVLKTQAGKSHDYREVIVSKTLRFENVFCPHENEKRKFSLKFLGLKSVFKKPRFHDGLAWTVGLTVEIKLRFQIPPAWCERGLKQINVWSRLDL